MHNGAGHGMVTFDQSLYRLYAAGDISEEDALRNADSSNDLRLNIHMGRGRMQDRLVRVQPE